jgi:hypothetical protein
MLTINGNIKTPDMFSASGLLGTDPVTNITTAKLSGNGTVQGINSRIVLTATKTNFAVAVDTLTLKETVSGISDQLVVEGSIEENRG